MITNIYIIKSRADESFFSFVSDLFSVKQNLTDTVILELNSIMIELSDMTKYEAKDYELDLIKKCNKSIPLYLNFKPISEITYFLSEKSESDDLYTCEYIDSNSNPVFTIELNESNKFHTKYKITWNEKIIEQDLLIYLLEWIFVKK